MAKTPLSLMVALGLVLISAGLLGGRWFVAGADPEGLWRISVTADGEIPQAVSSFVMALPPDFRHQHIFQERFRSDELLHRIHKPKNTVKQEVVWRRARLADAAHIHFTYSFRCDIAKKPTPAMAALTQETDAPPGPAMSVKPTPGIESDHPEIFRRARDLIKEDMIPIDQVETFYRYVNRLNTEAGAETASALECLRADEGSPAAKSKLLIALCRNRGIPARLVRGLILGETREQKFHYWAEAWVNDHWLPMCPTYHFFGSRRFPSTYLVFQIGEDALFRGLQNALTYQIVVDDLHQMADSLGERPTSWVSAIWRLLSFYSLRPPEQTLVKFLLLLPLAALIVSIFRALIGVPTFGTFSPALLGLAFIDLKALPWGLAIFVLTVLVGWGMRHVLDFFHLLLVPRTSILLTMIVTFLIGVILVASRYGIAATQFISLFPLVILTHLVERFWTVEAEDGTSASFKTLLGTLVVSVTISIALSSPEVRNWMFRYPETLGFVVAGMFVLGRYTGYRLSELYRFQDLLREDAPKAGKP